MARLTPERMSEIERETQEMMAAQSQQQQNQYLQTNQEMMLEDKEKSMIDSQLDLDAELMLIENLLRGRVLKQDQYGGMRWTDPEDPDLVTLTDHGIHTIMNTITFYINKNTLLSFYDEDTINNKMKDLATALTDYLFMNYEKTFQMPTQEECKKVLIERLKKKQKNIMDEGELRGMKLNPDAVWKKLIDDIADYEKEIIKIKEQKMKDKLKKFELLIRTVQDAIHSTYLRALYGQERRTLRQHIHVTESLGNNMNQQNQGSFNPLSWVRGNVGK